jgi:hypothetical protein
MSRSSPIPLKAWLSTKLWPAIQEQQFAAGEQSNAVKFGAREGAAAVAHR